jgi:hypothetical protein
MTVKKSIKRAWKRIARNTCVRDGVVQVASTIGTLLLATVTKRVPRR